MNDREVVSASRDLDNDKALAARLGASAPAQRNLHATTKRRSSPHRSWHLGARYIDGHHVKHWANGGEMKLGNLVSLCRFHHHAVHAGGIHIVVLDDGAFRFIKPNGDAFDSIAEGFTQPLSDWTELVAANDEKGIHIDSKTAATRWCGETMDYGLGVEVLIQQHRRAKAAFPDGIPVGHCGTRPAIDS